MKKILLSVAALAMLLVPALALASADDVVEVTAAETCLQLPDEATVAAATATPAEEPVEDIFALCAKRAQKLCSKPPFNQDEATYQACLALGIGVCMDAHGQ